MKNKILKLKESDILEISKKILNGIREDDFSIEPHIPKIPREKQIEKLFGKYEEQIPNDILRYMRKNPQLMLDRLAMIYGDKFLDYAEKSYIKFIKKSK